GSREPPGLTSTRHRLTSSRGDLGDYRRCDTPKMGHHTESQAGAMKILCVIPTFNESGSIAQVIFGLRTADTAIDILVVDDGSTDGTLDIIKSVMAADARVHLLSRISKQCLGASYRAGFDWGITRGYQLLVEIDGDLSRDPRDLPRMLKAAPKADLVIGSRYIKGGSTAGWSPLRKLISRTGNRYVQRVLRLPVADATAGYRVFHHHVLRALPVSALTSTGYCFQVETAYLSWIHGFRIQEVPIVFREREAGQSKMSSMVVLEALAKVTRWGLAAKWCPAPHSISNSHWPTSRDTTEDFPE
ncbi:polyprenol monophosphomannose synthase, partial [Candidatus Frankia alpina]